MIVDERENAMYGAGPWETVYLFAVGHGTDPKWNPVKAARGADKCLNVLKKCGGFVRVMPVWPRTLAVFDTLEDAKAAKEKIPEAGELMEARMNRRSGKVEPVRAINDEQ